MTPLYYRNRYIRRKLGVRLPNGRPRTRRDTPRQALTDEERKERRRKYRREWMRNKRRAEVDRARGVR
jgi:hypothetical protein